jgi:hypothetical protein
VPFHVSQQGDQISAQVTTADAVGTVTDITGAVVSNAKVTIENSRMHETRISSFSANGQEEALNNNMINGTDNNEREQGLLMVRPPATQFRKSK